VAIEPAEPGTTDDLTAVIVEESEDPQGTTVDYAYAWYVDGELASSDTSVAASETAKGQTWTLEVVANDKAQDGEPGTATAEILNTPPVAEVAWVDDDPAGADDLELQLVGTDADGDPVSFHIAWTRNGEAVPEHDDAQLVPASATAAQEAWVASVVPDDGEDEGEQVDVQVTIGNHAPSLDSVTLNELSPSVTDTLVATVGETTDEDGDEVAVELTWTIDGSTVQTDNLSGGDSSTLGVVLSKGDEVQAHATPSDGLADGDTVSSEVATVGNSPPVIDAVSFDTTSPTESSGLTVSVETSDPDGDSVSLSYAWYVDGAESSNTDDDLDGGDFDKDDAIYVVVTPSDGTEDGDAVTSETVTAVNTAPEVTLLVISPSSAYTEDDLSATVSTDDDDDDDVSLSYTWTVDGVATSTAETLDASATEPGDVVGLSVTPDDGDDEGELVEASTVTIQNHAPVAAATAEDDEVEQCQTITVDGSGSSDEEGEDLSYVWTLSSVPGASSLDTTDIDDADEVTATLLPDVVGTYTFQLTVSDGTDTDTDDVDVDVSARSSNTDPVADAGDDQTDDGYATCKATGYTYVCTDCSGGTYTLDASGTTDSDGDELRYTWSTGSAYATIDDDEAESTTLTIADLPATYGESTETEVNVLLRVEDCAGGADEDYVTVTFSCEGI